MTCKVTLSLPNSLLENDGDWEDYSKFGVIMEKPNSVLSKSVSQKKKKQELIFFFYNIYLQQNYESRISKGPSLICALDEAVCARYSLSSDGCPSISSGDFPLSKT